MSDRPVRIKAYGLFEVTRSGYLRTQVVVLAIAVVLVALAFLWQPTGSLANNFLFGYLKWWFLLVLVYLLAETAIMLRKFRAKEAKLR